MGLSFVPREVGDVFNLSVEVLAARLEEEARQGASREEELQAQITRANHATERLAALLDGNLEGEGVRPPRYRCHLGCILLKMPATSLLTGQAVGIKRIILLPERVVVPSGGLTLRLRIDEAVARCACFLGGGGGRRRRAASA